MEQFRVYEFAQDSNDNIQTSVSRLRVTWSSDCTCFYYLSRLSPPIVCTEKRVW